MNASPRELLIQEATLFHSRGWMPATSGNLSIRPSPSSEITITASGVDKGALRTSGMLEIDTDGNVTNVSPGMKPSAETSIHLAIYRQLPTVGAVFHVHTVASTVASMAAPVDASPAQLTFQGYELIKGYDIWEDDAAVSLPVFDNHADVSSIARKVEALLNTAPRVPAFLIRGHGITAWGATPAEARRHLEVTEFLCECELRQRA